MVGLREKEIALIKDFFKAATLKKASTIPVVICGIENGSGHDIIIKHFRDSSLYNLISPVSCRQFSLDTYQSTYQIIKTLYNYFKEEEISSISQVAHWLNCYEKKVFFEHSSDYLSNLLADFIISCSQKESILIVVENLHFASYFKLKLINKIIFRIESLQLNLTLNLLLFYRFEEFIDISLKKIIAILSEKGLFTTVRNVVRSEYGQFLARYFSNVTPLQVQQIWQISHGNVLVFEQIIDYLQHKKGISLPADIGVVIDLLPISIADFYLLYLADYNRLEQEILEVIAYITAPISQGFMIFLTKESAPVVTKAFKKLLKQNLISQSSYFKEKYNLVSFDLRNYIFYRNNEQYNLARAKYLLEKYEEYYQKEQESQLLILVNLSLRAGDKKRHYKYLKLLSVEMKEDFNSFSKIEILSQLILLETNFDRLADYVSKLACALIEAGKNRSAIELLVKRGGDLRFSAQDRFRINLLLLELYLSFDYVESSRSLIRAMDEQFRTDYQPELLNIYYQAKIRLFLLLEKSREALILVKAVLEHPLCDHETVSLLKAEALYQAGYLNNARKILLDALSYNQHKRETCQLGIINFKLGELEFLAGNYDLADNYYQTALFSADYCEDISQFKMKILTRIAALKLEQNLGSEAIDAIYNALNLDFASGMGIEDIEIVFLLGCYYMQSGSYEKANSCFKTAQKRSLASQNAKQRLVYMLKLAECQAFFHKSDFSEESYLLISQLLNQEGFSNYKDLLFLSQAQAAIYQNDFDTALNYLDSVVDNNNKGKIFVIKTVLEMRIGYYINNGSLIKYCTKKLKPLISEYGGYILKQITQIKNELKTQRTDE